MDPQATYDAAKRSMQTELTPSDAEAIAQAYIALRDAVAEHREARYGESRPSFTIDRRLYETAGL